MWVRDANVQEALRRGAEEVWLIWCIGNSPYWGEGPLEQYVHMIEMSAMGALLADFDAARAAGRDFVLHVVRPAHPLPLDPEFYLGRISADALVAMGYRDAREYLASRAPEGLPKDEHCTAMSEPAPGVRYTDRLRGSLDGQELGLTAVVEMPAGGTGARLSGFLDSERFGARRFLAGGRVEASGDMLRYRAEILLDGRSGRVDRLPQRRPGTRRLPCRRAPDGPGRRRSPDRLGGAGGFARLP